VPLAATHCITRLSGDTLGQFRAGDGQAVQRSSSTSRTQSFQIWRLHDSKGYSAACSRGFDDHYHVDSQRDGSMTAAQ
jgi:hypothetical protein